MLTPWRRSSSTGVEQALGFRESEGNWWAVEDQDAAVLGQGAGDFDHLLLRQRQPRQRRPRVDIQPQTLQIRAQLAVDAPPVDEHEAPARFAAQKEIGPHIEIVEVVEFLMHKADAEARRRRWRQCAPAGHQWRWCRRRADGRRREPSSRWTCPRRSSPIRATTSPRSTAKSMACKPPRRESVCRSHAIPGSPWTASHF